MSNKIQEIDEKLQALQIEMAALERERRIQEFTLDPDGYEAQLLAGAAPNKEKDGFSRKPAGTHQTLESIILGVFSDYPDAEFTSGTMLSKVVDRGWVTRCRSPGTIIATTLASLFNKQMVDRPARGYYIKKN